MKWSKCTDWFRRRFYPLTLWTWHWCKIDFFCCQARFGHDGWKARRKFAIKYHHHFSCQSPLRISYTFPTGHKHPLREAPFGMKFPSCWQKKLWSVLSKLKSRHRLRINYRCIFSNWNPSCWCFHFWAWTTTTNRMLISSKLLLPSQTYMPLRSNMM